RSRQAIEEGARRALLNLDAVSPYDPGRPAEIRVEFTRTEALAAYARHPGCEVVGDRLLQVRGDDWWSAWRSFYLS
ncbi:MAG: M55 family metallopeptidase, partial [Candidatus Dormibacteraceae bacterium]